MILNSFTTPVSDRTDTMKNDHSQTMEDNGVDAPLQSFLSGQRRNEKSHVLGQNCSEHDAKDEDQERTMPTVVASASYKRSDFTGLNLLARHPVWIFDVERKGIWWANNAAVVLWRATSLEDLLDRDFSDMSESTNIRMNEFIKKFNRGERVVEQVNL